jgi:GWxTD domain-containing protein
MMRSRFVPTLVLTAALGTAAAASAAISKLYADWHSGPAQLLFTDADRDAWTSVADDAAAERFVQLFWLRRDPTPGTPDNEFRRDFERRVVAANQHFPEDLDGVITPGWKTDRGRTFILLGPPERRQRSGSEGIQEGGDLGVAPAGGGGVVSGSGAGLFGSGGTQDRLGISSDETWIYEKEHKPQWIQKKRVTVKFRSKPGKPTVSLYNSEEALALMAEARRLALISPTLGESALAAAPASPGLSGGPRFHGASAITESPAVLALRSAAAGTAAGGIAGAMATGAFQASDGTWYVPLHVSLPQAPPPGTVAFGELEAIEGSTRIAFELPGEWKSGPGQVYTQGSLVPPPGSYTLRAGLRDAGGQLLWSGSERIDLPAAAETFWLSEITLSEQIAPLEKAQDPLQPYAWQGIAVLPNATRTFRQGGLLWIYLHACQPSLDASGRPQIQAQVEVRGAARFQGAVRGEPVKAGDRCWVVAQAFDLTAGAFPVGDYEIEVKATSGESGPLSEKSGFRVIAAAP